MDESPDHPVVASNVQGLLPALTVLLEVKPQKTVLDYVGWIQLSALSKATAINGLILLKK